MIKNLGVLTLEQKQEIWKNRMSGSQVSKVLQNPQQEYLIKTGQKEMIDLSKTKAKRWLDMGNFMEPVIIEMAKNSLDLDIKTDKSTFEHTEDDFYTANIDGFIGKDFNNIQTIIEIKNTTEGDIDKLLSKYLPQIDYYMWFFQAPTAKLIALVNGNDLKVVDIQRNIERESTMLAKLQDFQINFKMGMEPAVVDNQTTVEGDEAKELIGDFDVERLIEVKEEIKSLKEEEKGLTDKIKVTFEAYDKAEFIDGSYVVTKVNGTRKGAVDTKALILDLCKETGHDYATITEAYRKAPIATETVRTKEAK